MYAVNIRTRTAELKSVSGLCPGSDMTHLREGFQKTLWPTSGHFLVFARVFTECRSGTALRRYISTNVSEIDSTVLLRCATYFRFCECSKSMSIFSEAGLHKPRLKAVLTLFQNKKHETWLNTISTEFQKNTNPAFIIVGKALESNDFKRG